MKVGVPQVTWVEGGGLSQVTKTIKIGLRNPGKKHLNFKLLGLYEYVRNTKPGDSLVC